MSSQTSKKGRYKWGIARRVIQIVAFFFFIVLIMSARYPVNPSVPHNALVKFNPFTQLFLSLRQIGDTSPVFIIIFVLLLFLVTGRAYCGWVCPVGSGLDMYNRFIGYRLRKKNRDVRKRSLRSKNVIFITTSLLLLGGVSLYWLFDPTSMFTRNTALIIDPAIDAGVRETTRALADIPEYGYQIERTMRNIFNPMPVYSKWLWLFLIILVLIFSLEVFAQRFWCKVLCPLGAMLGYFNNLSVFKIRSDKSACTKCRACVKVCKTHALEIHDELEIDNRECILCLRCVESCNFDAINSFTVKPHPVPDSNSFMNTRRELLKGIVSVAVIMPVYKLTDRAIERPKHLIRPPGAIDERIFPNVCAKCGSCMKVCYTSGIQPVMLENGLNSIFTPRMDNVHGFCGYECNDCGNVCPTGAIVPLSLETKQKVVMGVAEIDRQTCWPWAEKAPCLTCDEVCPIHEKAIELEHRPTEFDDRDDDHILLPHVIEENCIGCGICEHHCPVEPEKAIKIIYKGEMRGGEYRKTPLVERREDFVTDDEVYWEDQ